MILSFNKQTLWRNRSRRICKEATLLCIISATLPLAAQTAEGDSTINRNITIEREYRPVIQDAGKINTLPHFAEPKVTKITPRYTTDFSKPLNVDQNIHYLSSAELTYQRQPSKEGYARVGVGTGFNSLADFAYPLLKKPDMKLDFRLNHYGLFNRKAHSNTQATLAFDKQFKALDLFAGVGGGHEYFKYYGKVFDANNAIVENPYINSVYPPLPSPYLLPAQNHLWRFNAYTGLQGSTTSDKLRYGVVLNYDLFDSRLGVTEHALRLDANVDGEVGGNRLGVNIRSENLLYKATFDQMGRSTSPSNQYVLSVNPYYSFEKEAFDLKLGFKSSFSLSAVTGRPISISPDVHVEWRAVPHLLSVYAGAGGGYKLNTFNDIHKENCYLAPGLDIVDATYTIADFYLGLKLKPVAGFLLDVYADYQLIDHQYFFVNDIQSQYDENSGYSDLFTNRFNVQYGNANLLKVGGRLSYNYHDKFSIQLSGVYNHWGQIREEGPWGMVGIPYGEIIQAWHKPAFEADLSIHAHPTKKLSLYGTLDFAGKRYAEIGDRAVELKPIIDINLGASYAFLDWLSAFLKVNNLINNKYELWNGYEAQGFNVMAGATFSF